MATSDGGTTTVKTVAFFNNKGGVGKTTLACNYAAFEAQAGKKVLMLDLDPQCNTTQLLLDENQWSDIYEDSATSQPKTVMSLFKIYRAGDSSLDEASILFGNSHRFGVDVLPGHPSFSVLEDLFSEAWSKFKGGDAGGARRSMWLHTFRELDAVKGYDVIVVDVSPSLGSINRTALVGSDYFLTPMAADLFSLYALDNITFWFENWLNEYEAGKQNVTRNLQETGYETLLPKELSIKRGYVGYTVQQYVSRTSSGKIRPVKAYDNHRAQIPERAKRLIELSGFSDASEIGTVPNMFSMIPLAQTCHSPIAGLTKEDGLRGAQPSQQVRYSEQLARIFKRVSSQIDAA